jgi:hypothetical protein
MEGVLKIKVVILSEAKNLFLSFQVKGLKEEIFRTKALKMTRKGRLARILEHS